MNRNQPDNWAIAPLSAIAQLIRGVTFSGSEAESSPKPGYLPVLRAGNIAETLITNQDLVWIPESRVSSEQRMRKDDIAICMSSGSSALVGKTARLEKDWLGCVGAFFAIIRPQKNMSADFLAHYLAGPQFAYWRRTQAQGANIQNLRVSELERVKVPIPPLSEQQRIVEILQEAEKIRRLREQAITNRSRLIASIFRGLFGDPSSWSNTTKLGDCVKIVGGGTPSRDVARYFDGDIPWATSKDIKQDYLDDAQEHITEDAISKSATNLTPAGTVLIVVKSKILAHSIPMSITTKPFCFGQDIKGMIPKAGFTPEFIVASLQAQKDRVLSRARGVNTEGLTLEALNSLNLPFATSEKIKSFTDAVLEHRKMSEAVMQSSITGQKLMDSILSHAFTGQLTQNWRERHQPQLEQEAQQRDAALQAAGARISRPVRAEAVEARYTRRSDGAYAELTREQHAVLESIPRGADAARWFTPTDLAATIDGPLRGNSQAIASHLAVLAARGLVLAASLEQTAPDTGAVFYGNAYRLPLDDFEPAEGDSREAMTGDRARLREMERLVAQLEKGR